MKKVLAALIIGSCLYFCGLALSESLCRPRVDRLSSYPFVVRVLIDDRGCSGVVVRKGYIVTASHCFGVMDSQATVNFTDGHNGVFKVLYRTIPGHFGDFAILKGDTGVIVPPPLSTITPQP